MEADRTPNWGSYSTYMGRLKRRSGPVPMQGRHEEAKETCGSLRITR